MKLTIGLPVYNAGLYLESCIKSILRQTYEDFTLVIVDDGSSDQSLEIARSFADKRIKIFSDGCNKKLPARLNQIISISETEYIARMDADDLILNDRIEKQIIFLEKHKDVDLVSTGLCSITNDNKIIGIRLPAENPILNVDSMLKGASGIIHASVMARKEWAVRNPYNESSSHSQDYELWLKAFLKNDLRVGFIHEPLYLYREEQNVTFEKMMAGYNQQISIIKSLIRDSSVPINIGMKNYYIYRAKKIIASIIFKLGQEKILLEGRSSMADFDDELFSYIENQIEELK